MPTPLHTPPSKSIPAIQTPTSNDIFFSSTLFSPSPSSTPTTPTFGLKLLHTPPNPTKNATPVDPTAKAQAPRKPTI